MASSLVALSEELAAVVQRAGECVVAVHARPRFDSSGVHWKPGIIVTADHAIRRDEDIRITAANGRSYATELAGRDPGTDLAVLRVKDLDAPTLTASNNGTPPPGSILLAVGRSKDSASAVAAAIFASISSCTSLASDCS